MAKSMRSKVKKTARRLKRETGTYAVHDAARLDRLNKKLLSGNSNAAEIGQETEETAEDDDEEKMEQEGDAASPAASTATASEPKISTSGPRNSRREEWRASKGMKPRTTSNGMTSKGKLRGARKSGRPARRR